MGHSVLKLFYFSNISAKWIANLLEVQFFIENDKLKKNTRKFSSMDCSLMLEKHQKLDICIGSGISPKLKDIRK
jgi:hypothetical protein